MKELKLKLKIEEVNTILAALGNMPYSQVFQLVSNIHQQAAEQTADETPVMEAKGKAAG